MEDCPKEAQHIVLRLCLLSQKLFSFCQREKVTRTVRREEVARSCRLLEEA